MKQHVVKPFKLIGRAKWLLAGFGLISLLMFTTILSSLPQHVSAAAASAPAGSTDPLTGNVAQDAGTICDAKYDPNQSESTATNTACRKGYGYEKAKEAGKSNKKQSDVCPGFGGANTTACNYGWQKAADKSSAGSTQDTADSATADACTDATSADEAASCSAGAGGPAAGKTQAQACAQAVNKTACENAYNAATGTGTTDHSSDDSSGDNEPGLKCKVHFYNPLTWLVCGFVKGMVNVVSGLDDAITSQLSVGSDGNSDDPNQIFCDNNSKATLKDEDGNPVKSCNQYHAAWSSFRNIALGLLIVVGLIVVISQAIGSEIIDAYTVRKILPRLIFAAIGITLSWEIMQFFVTFTNDLGYGVRFLIYQPFSGLSDASLTGGGQVATGLIGTAAVLALGIFGVASYALTAALAVAVAFLVLIVRQLLIIVLIITAPIAIVSYILPNTQNMYKLWYDSFAKALMMFPLIAAFIATGRVFSAVAAANSSSSIGQLIGFVAYFAPYFLLPLTFRFAGGALRGIGGFVNDRGRGGFDRLKRFRAGQTDKNLKGMQNFTRFKGKYGVSRAANTALGAAANPKSMLRGRRGVRAAQSARQTTAGQDFLKNNAIYQANAGDDAFQLAIADEELAKQKIADARFKSKNAATPLEREKAQQDLYSRERALDNARAMGNMRLNKGVQAGALMELAKTGYQYSQGEQGYNELANSARKITGGDERAFTGLMDQAQYHEKNAGRFDLAGLNHGAGYDAQSGTNKASLYELANAKPESIKAMTYGLDAKPLDQDHVVAHKELSAMLPSAKGGARDAIIEEMGKLETMGVKSNTTFLNAMDTSSSAERRLTRYDPTRHTGWSAAEQAAGYRYENRQATNQESAERRARTYERPDPNHI